MRNLGPRRDFGSARRGAGHIFLLDEPEPVIPLIHVFLDAR
jgi:hypothetical protein